MVLDVLKLKEEFKMATVDDFTTAEDGWWFVSHFLGNRLFPIRAAIEAKRENLESKVAQIKQDLIEKLQKIVKRMAENGHTEDSLKVAEICKMVEESDLTIGASIDAIMAKNLEYNKAARAMKAKVEELSGNR